MAPTISADYSPPKGTAVRLMSPEYVRPYVKAQKNDDHDAEGIAEAATRPTMRFVELKNEAQLRAPRPLCLRAAMVRRRSVIQSIMATRWAARYNPPGRRLPHFKNGDFSDGSRQIRTARPS